MPRVHKCSSRTVINQILDRPLEWVEWKELPLDARKQWSNEAVALLNNRVFQSICGKSSLVGGKVSNGEYVKILIENIARHAKSFEETNNARQIILAIDRIKEMVEEMVIVERQVSQGDLNAAI